MTQCQAWLKENHPDMYDRIWSSGASSLPTSPAIRGPPAASPTALTEPPAEALEAATASLSLDAQKRAEKDSQKKAARAEAAQQKQADKLAKSVVVIKRIERNKKKFVTAVSGLEAFGLDLKKVRFPPLCFFLSPAQPHSILSSTSRPIISASREPGTNTHTPKIAKDFGKKFATGSSVTKTPSGGEEIVVQGDVSPEIEDLLLETYKDIPADNIEFIDDKKKKKAAAAAAAAAAG